MKLKGHPVLCEWKGKPDRIKGWKRRLWEVEAVARREEEEGGKNYEGRNRKER